MVVHASPYHPAFWRLKFRKCPQIILDGEPIHGVIAADDKRGMVLTYERGPDGWPLIDREQGRYRRTVMKGRVEIRAVA